MTRKEQIYATIETFLEDNDIGKMTFPSELSAELADRIFALPIDVQGDDEIGKKANGIANPESKKDFERGEWLGVKEGARWMRDEILKRNRP
jgi:hypothetical protein